LQLKDIGACTLLVELDLRRPYPSRGNDLKTWEVNPHVQSPYQFIKPSLVFNCLTTISELQALAALPFLDRELSPALYRSFFVPYKWQQNNVFGLYKLLRRLPTDQH
jgi:alpha-1,2-mannosyltransferase